MCQWLVIAFEKTIFFRSLKVALTVGTMLMLINHGERLLSGTLELQHGIKIALTYLVPYMVSTYSSITTRLEQKSVC